MPPIKVRCPECDAQLSLGASAVPGKKIKCPRCETRFAIDAPAHDEVERRPARRRRAKRKPTGAPVAAIVGGVLALSLVVGGLALGGYMLVKSKAGRAVAASKYRVPDVVPPAGVGTQIGQLAKEIVGEDIDGVKFKLSDYRGKVVVLDFWGHW